MGSRAGIELGTSGSQVQWIPAEPLVLLYIKHCCRSYLVLSNKETNYIAVIQLFTCILIVSVLLKKSYAFIFQKKRKQIGAAWCSG